VKRVPSIFAFEKVPLNRRRRIEAGETVTDHQCTFVGGSALVWAALGIAVTPLGGRYTNGTIVFALLGVIGLMLYAFVPSARRLVRDDIGIAFAALIAVALAITSPAGSYGSGPWLEASHILTVVGACAFAAGLSAGGSRSNQRALLGLITLICVAADVSMIKSSPRPKIDVWYMYQASSRAILHGHNMYAAHWTSHVPGEVANGFSYLPGSALFLAPFNWLFGDVRYGLTAATVVAAWGVFWMATGPYAWALAAMILCFPKQSFGIEQSWNDPLLLALVVLFVFAVVSDRTRLSVLAFLGVLLCKQYGWLLIPLAGLWRSFGWRRLALATIGAIAVVLACALPAWRAFWHSVIAYPLHLPARWDSLSLNSVALRHGFQLGSIAVVFGTLLAIGLSAVLLPRTAFGFCTGAAVVLAAFVIFNNQVFYNEWQLVAEFTVLAAGISTVLASSPTDTAGNRRDLVTAASWRSTRSLARSTPSRGGHPAPAVLRVPGHGR
jgi:hypothetical protein